MKVTLVEEGMLEGLLEKGLGGSVNTIVHESLFIKFNALSQRDMILTMRFLGKEAVDTVPTCT